MNKIIISAMFSIILFVSGIIFFIKFLVTRRKRNMIFIPIFIIGLLFSVISIYFIGAGIATAFPFFALPPRSWISDDFSKRYDYNFQKIDYKPIVREGDGSLGCTTIEEKIPEEFKLLYEILDSGINTKLIIQENGEMLVRYGPPFTLQLYFFKIKHNIETIQLNTVEILTGKKIDIFELNDIYIETSLGHYYDYGVTEKYWGHESNSGQEFFDLFKKNKNIQTGSFIRRAKEMLLAKALENPNNPKYTTEFEREKLIEDCMFSSIMGFRNIPIDFYGDEKMEINIDIDLIMSNGDIRNFRFHTVYERQYEEGKMRTFLPPASYDHQKE
jgi:hypothetical protein